MQIMSAIFYEVFEVYASLVGLWILISLTLVGTTYVVGKLFPRIEKRQPKNRPAGIMIYPNRQWRQ